MSLLILVLASALAADPTDPAELAYAEMDALAVIDACRYGCDRTARELGEAFLIRATAAAVLRGEIDAQAAANARHLAPDLAASWGALLPGSHGTAPEAWVRDWGKTQPQTARPPLMPMPAAPRAAREPPPPREPGSPLPLTLDAGAPALARTTYAVAPERGALAGDAGLELRASMGPIGVLGGASVGHDHTRLPEPTREALGTDVDALNGRGGAVRLGAGPRWSDGAGREVFVYGAAVAEVGAVDWATWEALAADGFAVLPGYRGVGSDLIVLGVHPLPASGLAVVHEGGVGYRKRQVVASYLDPRRGQAGIALPEQMGNPAMRDAWARDVFRLHQAVELQWRPGSTSLTVAGGLGAAFEQHPGPRPDDVPRSSGSVQLAPRVTVAWAL